MRIDSIIISVLYSHFYQMKLKGRKVIPWFQTVAVLSFSFLVAGILMYFVLSVVVNKGHFQLNYSETSFLIVFTLLLVLLFILIKKSYFDTNRHLSFFAEFSALSDSKQRKYKFWVIGCIVLLPFVLIAILYLFDKR